MTECYYYVEQLPGVPLEECYIRPMCTKCHWQNINQECWHYTGPFPARELKCHICKEIIYDGRIKYEDEAAIQDSRREILPSEVDYQPLSGQLREHALRRNTRRSS